MRKSCLCLGLAAPSPGQFRVTLFRRLVLSCCAPRAPPARVSSPVAFTLTSPLLLPPPPPAPAVWLDPSACGGLPLPYPCRRPPPRDPRGGPPGKGLGEGRAGADEVPARLPHTLSLCYRPERLRWTGHMKVPLQTRCCGRTRESLRRSQQQARRELKLRNRGGRWRGCTS